MIVLGAEQLLSVVFRVVALEINMKFHENTLNIMQTNACAKVTDMLFKSTCLDHFKILPRRRLSTRVFTFRVVGLFRAGLVLVILFVLLEINT